MGTHSAAAIFARGWLAHAQMPYSFEGTALLLPVVYATPALLLRLRLSLASSPLPLRVPLSSTFAPSADDELVRLPAAGGSMCYACACVASVCAACRYGVAPWRGARRCLGSAVGLFRSVAGSLYPPFLLFIDTWLATLFRCLEGHVSSPSQSFVLLSFFLVLTYISCS